MTLARQARLAAGVAAYDPLVTVRGLPCFPARPRREQLSAEPGADLESHWADRRGEEPWTLTAGTDFNVVILATSLGMVPHIGAEILADSPRWRRMVSNVPTVATQAAQLWFRPADADLGAPHGSPTISGFAAPFQTYASMGHLLEHEEWPEDGRPQAVAYLCGPLADEAARQPGEAAAAVRRHTAEFLERRGGDIWPQAVDATGSFRWDVLTGDGQGGRQARLDAQYWTANIDPSDRYVQSPPGSTIHRLRADEAGYRNLFLAGDWTNCGLNAGCIEAAVLSGLQAANAVRGRPLLAGIAGSWYGLGNGRQRRRGSGGRRAMNRGDADGRAGPQRPDSFGPFQALTALTDVQRLGLDAATEVVRGFADLLDSQPPGPPPAPDPAGDEKSANGGEPANGHEPDLAQLRVIVARALDLYSDLVRRSFEGYADLIDQTLRSRGVQLDSGPGGLLTLQGAAGIRATATVWMHNTTARAASAEPRLTDLASHDGRRCRPRRPLPAGGADDRARRQHIGDGRGGPRHAAPGVYHGHVLARGLPDVALPVRLLVRAGNGRP